MNFCVSQGRLVGGHAAIPQEPFDFVWPGNGPLFGCNQLVCGKCTEPVRNHSGLVLTHPLNADEQQRLSQTDDWSLLIGDPVFKKDVGRVYACLCSAATVQDVREVGDDDEQPRMDNPLPSGWHCGGHPQLELPATIDGEQFAEGVSLEALVSAVLHGQLPRTAPELFGAYPAAWLQRVFHLLSHTGIGTAISRAVAVSLLSESFNELSAAVDFFVLLPEAEGAHALVDIPIDRVERELDRVVFFRKKRRFSELFQFALAGQLRTASQPPADLIEVARRAVLWPADGASRLYSALAKHDTEWFRENEAVIAVAHPGYFHLNALARQMAKLSG